MSAGAESPFKLASVGIGKTVVILLQSFALLAYKRALTPLFASVPATSYISYATVISSVLGSAVDVPVGVAAFTYGSLLAAAPNTVHYVGKYAARWKDPVLGPIVTHAIVLVPILVSGVALLHSVQRKDTETMLTRAFRLPVMLFILPSLETLWNSLEQLRIIPAVEIFSALAVVILSFWAGRAYDLENRSLPKVPEKPASKDKGKGKEDTSEKTPVPPPSKTWAQKFANIPSPHAYFIMITLTMASYHFSPAIHSHFRAGGIKAPYVHPSGNVTIVSSKQSVTGMIVVGETSAGIGPLSRMRYLRASHSLLGGVWIKARAATMDAIRATYDAAGNRLGDSIFPAFYLQEAVAQIDSTSRGNDWSGSEALIIGLGTGIAATALRGHGLETTIVEIDPAVYDAARTYFGVPDPGEGRLFLQDARRFIWNRKRKLETGENLPKFDVVIHDVFSGGGVPGRLFTLEFWNDLKSTMKEDGVIAVTYFSGKVGSKSSSAILSTLLRVFGQCRAFHDSMQELPDEKLREDFVNIVFFCTPVPATTKPMTFRSSTNDDYFGSYLRRHTFQNMAQREVALDTVIGWGNEDKLVLTDDNNPLSKWQEEDAPHHWQLMREVLPDIYWETF